MWWILLFLSTSPLFSGAKFEDESLERYHMRKKTSCNFNVTPSTDLTLLWSPSLILWQEAKKTKYRAHVSGRLQPWRSAKGFVGLYCPLSCRNILWDILVALCCFQWGRDCHGEDFNGVWPFWGQNNNEAWMKTLIHGHRQIEINKNRETDEKNR